jgi:iron complex transport system substrate-binding protein
VSGWSLFPPATHQARLLESAERRVDGSTGESSRIHDVETVSMSDPDRLQNQGRDLGHSDLGHDGSYIVIVIDRLLHSHLTAAESTHCGERPDTSTKKPTANASVRGAMRIVSLACSNTEIVCALGCADLLVGVDDHSDFPVEVVAPLPKVGPDLQIDVDRVAALEPDLVLATLTVPGHEEVVERLTAAGLNFIAPEPVSIADVYRDIREIGGLLGVPDRAEALVAEMRSELDADEPSPEAPTVLIQWWPKPVITPGRQSWATDVIRAAGGRAVLGDEDIKSRPMTDEEVADRRPDAAVLSWCGVHPDKYRPDVVLRNETWQDQSFVENNRVFCIGEPFLGRPGPRLVDGVREMRKVVAALREPDRPR